jgi:hypothetical protein
MVELPPRKLGTANSLAKQSGRDYFSGKPTYQGSGEVGSLFIIALKKAKVTFTSFPTS